MNLFVICNKTFQSHIFLQKNIDENLALYFVDGKPSSLKYGNELYKKLLEQNGFKLAVSIDSADEAENLRLHFLSLIDPDYEFIDNYSQLKQVKARNADLQAKANALAQIFDLPAEDHIRIKPGDKILVKGNETYFTKHLDRRWCTVVTDPDADFNEDPVVIDPKDPEQNRFVINREDVLDIDRDLYPKFQITTPKFDNI